MNKTAIALAVASLMMAAPVQAAEGDITMDDPDQYGVVRVYQEDANGAPQLIRCDATNAEALGDLYVHERTEEDLPFGTGYALGGGTWIYQESNGVAGLQIGGDGESDGEGTNLWNGEAFPDYTDCPDADTLIW